jgi:hypothetical protein
VPGVDVDVGKNAKGAIDVNVNKSNANEPAPGTTAPDMRTDRTMRAPRADRG